MILTSVADQQGTGRPESSPRAREKLWEPRWQHGTEVKKRAETW